MLRWIIPVLMLIGLTAGHAAADEPEVVFRKHTVHVFGDDTIDGRLDGPDQGWIRSRKIEGHESLIKVRESFRSEVLGSLPPG